MKAKVLFNSKAVAAAMVRKLGREYLRLLVEANTTPAERRQIRRFKEVRR